jgi:hypothetical protein
MAKRVRTANEDAPNDAELAPLPALPAGVTFADLMYMDNELLLHFFSSTGMSLRDLAAIARIDKALGLRMATLAPAIVRQHPAVRDVLRAQIYEVAARGKIEDWGEVLQWLPDAAVLAYMLDVRHDITRMDTINIHELVCLECAQLLDMDMSPGLRHLRLRVITDHVAEKRPRLVSETTTDMAVHRVYTTHGETLSLPMPPPDYFWTEINDTDYYSRFALGTYRTGLQVRRSDNMQCSRRIAEAFALSGVSHLETRQIARRLLYELVAVGYYDDPARARELDKRTWQVLLQTDPDLLARMRIMDMEVVPFFYMTPTRMEHLLRLAFEAGVNDSIYKNTPIFTTYLETLSPHISHGRPDLVLVVMQTAGVDAIDDDDSGRVDEFSWIEWKAYIVLRLCEPDLFPGLVAHDIVLEDTEEVPAKIAGMILHRYQADELAELIDYCYKTVHTPTGAVAVIQRAIRTWPRLLANVTDPLPRLCSDYVHAAFVLGLLAGAMRRYPTADMGPVMPALRQLLLLPAPPPRSRLSLRQAIELSAFKDTVRALSRTMVRPTKEPSRQVLELWALLYNMPALFALHTAIVQDWPDLVALLGNVDVAVTARRWAAELADHGVITNLPAELTVAEQDALVDVLVEFIKGREPGLGYGRYLVFATVPHAEVVVRALTPLLPEPTDIDIDTLQVVVCSLVNNPVITSPMHRGALLRLLTGAERSGDIPLDNVDILVSAIWNACALLNVHGTTQFLQRANLMRLDEEQVIGGIGPRHVQWMALVARQLAWTEMLVVPNVSHALRGKPVLRWWSPITGDTWLRVHWQMFSDFVHFVGAQQGLQEKGPWTMRAIITRELGRDALMALRFVYASVPAGALHHADDILVSLLHWVDPEDATDVEVFGPLTRLVAQLLIETLVREMSAWMLTPANLASLLGVDTGLVFDSPLAVVALLTAALLEARGMALTAEDQEEILDALEVEDEDSANE